MTDGAWIGSHACLRQSGLLLPHFLGSYVPQMNRRYSDYGCYYFNFFCLFSFFAFKGKKNLWPIQVGFLHYNINTICTRSWQAPSFFSNSSAPSCNQIAELSQKQAQLGQSGQYNKYTTLNGQLSLSLQPRDSGYFIS